MSKVYSQSSHLPKASYHGVSADMTLKLNVLTELQYSLTFRHKNASKNTQSGVMSRFL
ncbi:hypothetical protein PN497_08285 [Sphaerospermopsis kisseleviana CS-549]|uniref:Uncharacterized protein n=1 Tax=Sphaerospermopsis kisseleviana CS-549 TaxID=3021783 RepID=A0ABT4ZQA6_9CYAN|nr:hypothetical protein [Sphaerospermopsis kisseleviana CS-549]